MLQVGDVHHDFHVSLAVFGTGIDVADIGFGVADDGRDLLQHAKTVVAENGQLDRDMRPALLRRCPTPRRCAAPVHTSGSPRWGNRPSARPRPCRGSRSRRLLRRESGCSSARDRPAGRHGPSPGWRCSVAAKDAPHHAGDAAGLRLPPARRPEFAGRRNQLAPEAARRKFAVADGGHQIVRRPRP